MSRPAAAAAALALASCADGPATAARAALVVAVLAGAVVLARARRPGAPPGPRLRLEERAVLGRESGVALVRAGRERLLVGWGREGVRLLGRLRGEDGSP